MEIFAAALDYAPAKMLDGRPCTWIRLRVLVDGQNIWKEESGSVAEHLEANEIPVHGIRDSVARINARDIDLSIFAEYDADAPVDGICLRTFLTVESDGDLFAEDSAWNKKLGSKTIREWYSLLQQIPIV